MNPEKIKKWLTEEERKAYENAIKPALSLRYKTLIGSLESLAAERELSETRRALLEKHEWVWDKDKEYYECVDCGKTYPMGTLDWKMKHKPDCAWDAALKGKGE